MTQHKIEEVCREWQKRLRLQDWDIEVKIKRYHDLDAQGRCTVTEELKYAEILLRDPVDTPETPCVGHQDIETVLVHELLHIPLWAVAKERSEAERIAEEQAIVSISKCLVSLGRIMPT